MINRNNIKNMKTKADGSKVGQCPACAAFGGDKKGEHLFVSDSGGFSCIAHPRDKEHNRLIMDLLGSPTETKTSPERYPHVTVRPKITPERKVICSFGRMLL